MESAAYGRICYTQDPNLKKAKSNKSKVYRKRVEKLYTKHKVNVLIEKKLKLSRKGSNVSRNYVPLEKMDISGSEESNHSLDDSDASSKSDDS